MPDTAPQSQKEPVGPMIGTFIILILMVFGAFYYWNARQTPRTDTVPYIVGDSTTTVQ